MTISVIVPCYNEEKNIEPLVGRFREIRKRLPEGLDLELVLVDNGSLDGTWRLIQACSMRFSWISKVTVPVNKGYGYGIISGLRAAEGDCLGWIHADLQAAPEVFLKMADAAEKEQGDFLYKGMRRRRPVSDTLFTIGMSLFETAYLRTPLWDINAQPTLLSRGMYGQMADPPHDFSLDLYVYYLARRSGVVVRRFPSPQQKRMHGASSWNTGMRARIRLIGRVLGYSRKMKRTTRLGCL